MNQDLSDLKKDLVNGIIIIEIPPILRAFEFAVQNAGTSYFPNRNNHEHSDVSRSTELVVAFFLFFCRGFEDDLPPDYIVGYNDHDKAFRHSLVNMV